MFPYCQHSLLIPPKCLGFKLRPFSLGHIDLLTALENPVVTGGVENITPAEVSVAVWVCSRSYEQAIEQYIKNNPMVVFAMAALGAKFGRTPEKFIIQRDIFLEYLSTYFMAPPRWEAKPSDPVIPWHLSVFCAIQRDTNYTPSEVWNMPLPRALELFAAISANRGDDSLIPPNNQKIMDMMNSQEDAQ
jgi:hypothetical protein